MVKKKDSAPQTAPEDPALQNLPPEVKEKLEAIKAKLDKFQKTILEKFDQYIVGITLLPPPKQEDMQNLEQDMHQDSGQPAPLPFNKDQIHVLVLVDDSDSKKMPKLELKDKLIGIIQNVAKEVDPNLVAQTIILSELWQNCYDAKYEILQLIAMSAPVYDKGMLAAIKISEIHKTMVLKKFEKYIISYVLAGSLVQGRATPTSDIDVWIVIDDTDVKKMTRTELKDKLRAIIIGMGIEAGELTGVKNKINIQVYILTDFWDSLREANPIIFTLLRDGVPFYDRGIFMPWKQLLKMGKIKPSAEAIDMFMGSGEQMLKRVELKLKDIGMEDIYYAILTPSQAALMMFGIAPPAPKETAELMREVFCKKEKLLEEKFVNTLEKVIWTRKAIEHGDKKEMTGKEIDEMLTDSDKYLKRIKRLFSQIEKIREEKDMLHVHETVASIVRDVLRLEGTEKFQESEMLKMFDAHLVNAGKVPTKFSRILQGIIAAKKDYESNKLSKVDLDQVKKDASEIIKFLVEYVQRKRGRELDRAKIKVKHGNKFGEVILLDKLAFIIHDIDHEEKDISKATLTEEGNLENIEKSSLEELEHALAKLEIFPKVFIKERLFENLKGIFGKDVEILINQ